MLCSYLLAWFSILKCGCDKGDEIMDHEFGGLVGFESSVLVGGVDSVLEADLALAEL